MNRQLEIPIGGWGVYITVFFWKLFYFISDLIFFLIWTLVYLGTDYLSFDLRTILAIFSSAAVQMIVLLLKYGQLQCYRMW